ncbi:MAG: hypothetical protein RR426_08060, partial [Oscillospiraceae bacterium]
MNFFRKIGSAIARFMYGRNGVDQLGFAMVWASLILSLVSGFVDGIAATLLSYGGLLLWVVVLFRMFSKNVYRRQGENGRWMGFWHGIKGHFTGAKERRNDHEHKYFTCKNCKTRCRVPVGKGKIVITCPKCGG